MNAQEAFFLVEETAVERYSCLDEGGNFLDEKERCFEKT